MRDVIVIGSAWYDEECYIGSRGVLIDEPTNLEYGIVEVMCNGNKEVVYVDFKDYIPFSSLIMELF